MEPIEIDLKIIVDKPCLGDVQIVAHNGDLVRNYEQRTMPLDLSDLLLAALIDRERQRTRSEAREGKASKADTVRYEPIHDHRRGKTPKRDA